MLIGAWRATIARFDHIAVWLPRSGARSGDTVDALGYEIIAEQQPVPNIGVTRDIPPKRT
jgi:hypothetical protein